MTQRKIIIRTHEQKIASDPQHSAWVMANAGSGKTHVLVDRVVRLLLAGNAPESILCLTYTKAAATEMSLRLFKQLAQWIALDDETLMAELAALDAEPRQLARARQLFALAIETPGGLKIQTIHAFCESILHLFPVESGVAPGFRVMDETERNELLDAARHAALLDASEHAEDVIEFLEDGGLNSADGLKELSKPFLSATSAYSSLLRDDADPAGIEQALRSAAGLSGYGPTGEIEDELSFFTLPQFEEAAEVLAATPPYGSSKFDVSQKLRDVANAGDRTQLIEALFTLSFTNEGAVRGKIFKDDTRANHAAMCAWVDEQRAAIVDALTRHTLSRKVDASLSVIKLMQLVNRHFIEMKRTRGLYDFDDLIMRTRSLLNSSAAAQWVLYKLDGRLSHVLVDEAQDTSPAQWQIIAGLVDEFFSGQDDRKLGPRSLFVVGDIKQSIYSFQGADTDAFQLAQQHFKARTAAVGQEMPMVRLTVSYRSLPAVLEMVDVVFGKSSPATAGLKQESDDNPHQPTRRAEGQGIFELWPLMKKASIPERDNWEAPVDSAKEDAPRQQLASHVATTIKGWLGKRRLASGRKTVEAGDILILVQRRGPLFHALLAALRKAGIAVAGADRLRLQSNLAVRDVLALMQFVLLPEDDLSLACVLKSPLVPEVLSDDDLLAFAPQRRGSLWSALQASGRHEASVAFIRQCQDAARVVGPHGFVSHVVTKARPAMVARMGEEALDATDTLLDVALDYERMQGTSLASFLHWFTRREEDVKRSLEQAGGAVRLMTVHGAKGLEAPIVILPDAADLPMQNRSAQLLQLEGGGNGPGPLPFFDRKMKIKPAVVAQWKDDQKRLVREESMRLLYVAMTRAKDELYVAGAEGGRTLDDNCWYRLVERAVKDPASPKALRSIPGLHPDGEVLRWGDDPVREDGKSERAARDPVDLPAWLSRPAPVGSGRPVWSSPTRLASGEEGVFDRIAAERGIAIHRVLEGLTPQMDITGIEARLVRHRLSPALAPLLRQLLTSPATSALFGPEAQAEAAIAGEIEGLPPVRGQIDRLLIQNDGIWLVDFKTGRRSDSAPEHYVQQMAQYAALLTNAYPGRALRAALLWTQDAQLEELDSARLSRALDQLRQVHRERVA